MNEQLKKRLVGAIVLVALAVIFLPMLLDGSKRSGIPMFGSNVPPRPDYQTQTLDIPLEVPAAEEGEEQTRVIDSPPPAEPAPDKPAKPAASAPPKPAPKPTPPVTTPPSGEHAWAVQVGSFSRSDNALALRDKLRGRDYPAFVEEVVVGSDKTYRVRIGPLLQREEAEQLQAKLAKEQKLDGLVVRHP